MKKTLLTLTLLCAIGAKAQTVNNFYPLTAPEATYSLATSSPELDESTAGANVTWNFTNLNDYGFSETSVVTPTTAEGTTYPGTTSVIFTDTESGNPSQFFLANGINGGVSVTGVVYGGVTLNYSTNNFSLGTFPKSFDNTVTDDVAGTFTANGISGTFTGSGTTSVDAHGTLNLNIGADGEEATLSVTRLKITQMLTLNYLGAPIGTLTQTMNSYYAETPANVPVFRTITATVSVPGFNINETQQAIESYYNPTAGIGMPEALGYFRITPNPVAGTLHLAGANEITDITVTDTAGRIVARHVANDGDVSHLSQGIYVVSATTEKGTQTVKMVKQ
jgi:hypothetical protein